MINPLESGFYNKKISIGFYLNNSQYGSDIDLSNPMSGNPGIGGTDYTIILQAYSLANIFRNLQVVIFSSNQFQMNSETIQVIPTSGYDELMLLSKEKNIDYLILTNFDINDYVCNLLDRIKIKVISWTHIYIDYKLANLISKNENIIQNVFVGKQQFDYYFDHPIIKKSLVIFPGVPIMEDCLHYQKDSLSENTVTFMGALYHSKYFHVFAKYWRFINDKVSSKLNVIGSGTLYGKHYKLGPLGLASPEYEELFASYLKNQDGHFPSNIIFHGNLGSSKKIVFLSTKVGAVNPTGITETFCLSAVEMASYGIPVVTKNAWAYPDVIIHGKTGLLSRSEKDIPKNIVKILNNENLRKNLSEGAVEFVKLNFNIDSISTQWFNLLINLDFKKKLIYIKPSRPYFNQWKFIKIINAFIQSHTGIPTVSLIELERRLKDAISKSNNPIKKLIIKTYERFIKK